MNKINLITLFATLLMMTSCIFGTYDALDNSDTIYVRKYEYNPYYNEYYDSMIIRNYPPKYRHFHYYRRDYIPPMERINNGYRNNTIIPLHNGDNNRGRR